MATRSEIASFLATIPNAPSHWADVCFAAQMSMAAVERLVVTMSGSVASPLRRAEESLLNGQIRKLNGVMSGMGQEDQTSSKPLIRLKAVMTSAEAASLSALVSNFCRTECKTSDRFGHNGHVVMNAARRCTAAYNCLKLRKGASVVEVGPDVKHWIVNGEVGDESGVGGDGYVGARPNMNQRDVVRTDWESMAKSIIRNRANFKSEKVVDRAQRLVDSYDDVFPNVKVQDISVRGEYILSNDSNYDIKFDDMPLVMVNCGSRAWFGSMLRVKGLTSRTKLASGKLENMGVTYRVDWKVGRIDFRHPRCNAFGYSHDVHELIKYEECNGFVWETNRASYVYAKGPETNSELLFFSVVRVPKGLYLAQPSYVEDPHAGQMRVNSIWAVGGLENGLPTKFEPIEYNVDRLAFGKIYERRRALDTRGDLAQTLMFVRSTNVRMWLNGTPVGASSRISEALMEATAVAVEALVSQHRRRTALVFTEAMQQYRLNVERGSWMYELLESVIDLRSLAGMVNGTVTRAWGEFRGTLIDTALAPLSGITVDIGVVGSHIKLRDGGAVVHISRNDDKYDGDCACDESGVPCSVCKSLAERVVESVDPDDSTASSTLCDSDTEDGDDEFEDAQQWLEPDPLVLSELKFDSGWSEEKHSDRPEYCAMTEALALDEYLDRARRSEIRVDADRLWRAGCRTDSDVLEQCTSRTQHTIVDVLSNKLVGYLGVRCAGIGALYSFQTGKFHEVSSKGLQRTTFAPDGRYYTNNHMRVWNAEHVCGALRHAIGYGRSYDKPIIPRITLGTPGAGKTYRMMEELFSQHSAVGVDFVVLAVTGKASESARSRGCKFGFSKTMMDARVKTLDSYLINGKFPAKVLCVDEFTMAHFGKIAAAISLTGATDVRLFGDGRQIPYDPFTAEFEMKYQHVYGATEEGIKFLPEQHRYGVRTCASVVDVYPAIYPCKCCDKLEPDSDDALRWERIGGVDDLKLEQGIRYHTYLRSDKEEVYRALRFTSSYDEMKVAESSGLCTVHEDQGATHDHVVSIRLAADYDKNASPRNPSLFNRLSYVLTDMTRHRGTFVYKTTSDERDEVIKRIELSKCPDRIAQVRERNFRSSVTKLDMLYGVYNI